MMKSYAKTLTIIAGTIFAIALLIAILCFVKIIPVFNGDTSDAVIVNEIVVIVTDDLQSKTMRIEAVYQIYVEAGEGITFIGEQVVKNGSSTPVLAKEFHTIPAMVRAIKKFTHLNHMPSTIVVDEMFTNRLDTLYEKYKIITTGSAQVNYCEIIASLSDDEWLTLTQMSPDHLWSDDFTTIRSLVKEMMQEKQCYFEMNQH